MAGDSTRCVHAVGGGPGGALLPAVQRSTTYRYPELADGGDSPHMYARYASPTVEAAEAGLARLEAGDDGGAATAGATRAYLFSSGLAAAHAACHALLRPGDTIAVQQGVYGGTVAMLEGAFAPWGVEVHPLGPVEPPRLPEGTRLVWMESVTNPLLRVADVAAWAEASHAAGARLVVDATFASPLLQRPLSAGADVVVHSATKYLGGHGDLTAGVATTSDKETARALWLRRRDIGGTPDPEAAALLARGLRTLALRMERQCANATAVARLAAGHPGVERVHYPGLPGHLDHAVAQKVLAAPGGMVSLDLGSLEAAVRFRRAVRLVTPAASLGSVESLVSLPRETSHAYASEGARRREGITDGLVRISCGIEDTEDLLGDIEQALGAA